MLPKLKEFKHISEYRHRFDEFFSDEINRISDFNIYLHKYSCNLQREYCWSDFQKQELIHSILLCRHIPPITIVEYLANYYKHDLRNPNISDADFFKPKYQVIDGKQRLLTHKMFVDNQFSIDIDGRGYFFYDLPNDYQTRVLFHSYGCRYLKYEYFGDVTDDELVELFKWCNFAGTQQEKDYMARFSN